jgi:hypothetical protein
LRGGGCAEVTGPGSAGPLEAKQFDREVVFVWVRRLNASDDVVSKRCGLFFELRAPSSNE